MDFITLLAIVLPAVIVTVTAYLLLKNFLDARERRSFMDMKSEALKEVLPLRLQACERIMLMLERMRPRSLVFRIATNDMSASLYHGKLLENIRDEFEHNLSQQIYVTEKSWQQVVAAREEAIKLINNAAAGLNEEATGNDLAQVVFEQTVQTGTPALDSARALLKKEVHELF
jgi:hypothetical protein